MTPIKDFRRTILCYFSFSQRLWFSCFVVRWSVYSSRLKELHRRWVWELRRKRKRQWWGESSIRETNTWMPSQRIQTRMNSQFHLFILDKSWPWNCQGCFPMAGIRSELQNCQRWKESLFGVLESVDLWRWQRELGAHILEAITLNVLRYARHPEFLIATSLEWLL